jgi:hypothetical protein
MQNHDLKFKLAVADKLALQIEELINGDPDLLDGEIVTAAMMVIGNVIATIQCQGCRQEAAKEVKKRLPQIIAHALAQPIQPGQQHVH